MVAFAEVAHVLGAGVAVFVPGFEVVLVAAGGGLVAAGGELAVPVSGVDGLPDPPRHRVVIPVRFHSGRTACILGARSQRCASYQVANNSEDIGTITLPGK